MKTTDLMYLIGCIFLAAAFVETENTIGLFVLAAVAIGFSLIMDLIEQVSKRRAGKHRHPQSITTTDLETPA